MKRLLLILLLCGLFAIPRPSPPANSRFALASHVLSTGERAELFNSAPGLPYPFRHEVIRFEGDSIVEDEDGSIAVSYGRGLLKQTEK